MFFDKKKPLAKAVEDAVAKQDVDMVIVAAISGGEGSIALKGNYGQLVRGLRGCIDEILRRVPDAKLEDVLEDIATARNKEMSDAPEEVKDISSFRVSAHLKDGRIISRELSPVQKDVVTTVLGMSTSPDGKFRYYSDDTIKKLFEGKG